MKKIFLILLPIVFCLSTTHAQTWTDDELANGKVTRVKSGTKSAMLTYGVLDSAAIANLTASLTKLTNLLSDADSSLVLETARNLLDILRNTKLDSLLSNSATNKSYLLALRDSINMSLTAFRDALRGASNKTLTDIESAISALGIKDDTTHAILGRVEADVEEVRTNGVKVKAGTDMIGYTNLSGTIVSGAFTVGVVADTLSGVSVACKGVLITNNSPGKILYLIHNGSGTTSTGTPIYYLGSLLVSVTNLNKVYLISDSATTDVRYIYYQ